MRLIGLGLGFRCGFLGALHLDVVQQRLEEENGISLVLTAPSVVYRVTTKDGRVLEVDSPAKLPDQNEIAQVEERISLNEQRLGAVVAVLKTSGAKRVLDLGCGEGRLLRCLLKDKQFEHIVGLDVSYRALEMAQEIKGAPILGSFRGMPAVDMELLSSMLINAGKLGLENDAVKEVDANPLIISGNKPVVVDALVVLEGGAKP